MDATALYLDTARLGRMTPGAQRAHFDFARLAGEEGGSLFIEQFLRRGAADWSNNIAERYPGLAGWRGVQALKESLRGLAGNHPDLPVLLASRSAELMRLAARLLFHPCRNVLATDLGWPSYHEILLSECRRPNQTVTTVPVQEAILREGLTEDDVVAYIRDEFIRSGCDGLFLTSVSNLGLRLPVERIVKAVEAARQVWFVVIDGAQDFCHVSADLRNEYCDLYLAGAHKWLSAYHPLGLGFYGRRRSGSFIETVLAQLLGARELDDPLLRFCTQLEGDALDGTSETVSLAGLFSCHGAVGDAATASGPTSHLAARLQNLDVAASLGQAAGWRALLPCAALRSGILVLEAERAQTRKRTADELRSAFHSQGVALTAYGNGLIRLSMPEAPWQPGEAEQLGAALRASA